MPRHHFVCTALSAAGMTLAPPAASASLPTVPRCPDGSSIPSGALCPPGGPFIIRFEGGGIAIAAESRGPLENAVELYRRGGTHRIVVEVHRAPDRRQASHSRSRGMAVVRELVSRGVARADIRVRRPSRTSFRGLDEAHVQLLLYVDE